jgi:hypothetical protein
MRKRGLLLEIDTVLVFNHRSETRAFDGLRATATSVSVRSEISESLRNTLTVTCGAVAALCNCYDHLPRPVVVSANRT